MREPIYRQVEDGRWIWEVRGSPIPSGDHVVANSCVSFPDEPAAQYDHNLRISSRYVQNRWLVSQTELERLLRYAAEMSPNCVFDGRVVLSVPTADGCNWAIMWDYTNQRCKQSMSTALTKIRGQYNLTEE